jgi:hypothetical protein
MQFQLPHSPLLSRRTLLPASACGNGFARYTLPPYFPKICSKISHLRLMLGCDEAREFVSLTDPDLVLEATVLTRATGSSPVAVFRCPPVVAAIRPARPRGIMCLLSQSVTACSFYCCRSRPQRDMHHLKELRSVSRPAPFTIFCSGFLIKNLLSLGKRRVALCLPSYYLPRTHPCCRKSWPSQTW